jgi:hypothetical protein
MEFARFTEATEQRRPIIETCASQIELDVTRMPVNNLWSKKAWCLNLAQFSSTRPAFSFRRFLMVRNGLAAVILLVLLSLNGLADSGKVEPLGAFTDAAASDSVKKALEDKGQRILLPDGTVVCEIWFRKTLPTHPKTDVSGAIYNQINDSAVIAVVTFPKPATDFRGQDIKPGAYTLRYALHPVDGNHMGISPYRDFILLTPVAEDQNVEAQFKFEELVKLSAKTTGTKHPAMWSLVSADAKTFPSLSENEHSHLVLTAKVKTSAGAELPIAFVVKGQAEQ